MDAESFEYLGDTPLLFKTIHTYSDGHQDFWIETSEDPSANLEMPAPTLTLTGGSA